MNWNVNPEIIRIGSFGLRWYSLLFVGGFIIGYFIMRWFFRREGVSEQLLDPLLYSMLIATIIGARLGHCLFYQPDYYLGSWEGFKEIFMPWKGGLASHGGVIGIVVAVLWYGHRYGPANGIDWLWTGDRIGILALIAGAMIRLGNLMNSEIYGDVTNLPWGFVFLRNGETLPKHPTQIYEALGYLTFGLSLLALYKYKLDKLYRGVFAGLFFILCFGFRFLIEFIKEPQVEFEKSMALDMGQLLSIPLVLVGVCFIVYACRKKTPARAVRPDYRKRN